MHRIFQTALAQAGAGVAIRTPAGTIPAHVHPPSLSGRGEETDLSSTETDAVAPPRVVDGDRFGANSD